MLRTAASVMEHPFRKVIGGAAFAAGVALLPFGAVTGIDHMLASEATQDWGTPTEESERHDEQMMHSIGLAVGGFVLGAVGIGVASWRREP